MEKLKKDIVYQAIKFDIVSGFYPLGARLPNELDFARERNVSFRTMRAALQKLEEEGFIVRMPRKGTFVRQNRSETADRKPLRILVLAPDLPDAGAGAQFLGELLQGVSELAVGDGGTVSAEPMENGETLIPRFQAGEFDGVIWDRPDSRWSEVIERCHAAGIPQVTVNRSYPGIPSLQTDYNGGIRAIVHYLRRIGHHYIAYFDILPAAAPLQERKEQFIRLLRADGIENPEAYVIYDRYDDQEDPGFLAERLEAIPRTTAIIVSNVRMKTFEKYLKLSMREVPQQISVIQFGENLAYNRRSDNPFSIYTDPRREVGNRAYCILHARICGREIEDSGLVPGELVVRQSCALPLELQNYLMQKKGR